MESNRIENPFTPSAGHNPPYLAGRDKEKKEFIKFLEQKIIMANVILTGLRGVGKTVLLNEFKSLAISKGWLWVGNDLAESASVSEEAIAKRLLTDLSLVTSDVTFSVQKETGIGFNVAEKLKELKLSFENLLLIYESLPGLVSDKIKGILEIVWACLRDKGYQGIIFAYDEAQTISDQPHKEQYPVALILDVFQSIQRRNIPFMLVLTGLPTLQSKLVDSRTFAERMFKTIFLTKLSNADSREAIIIPIKKKGSPEFTEGSIEIIIKESGGYPYFIQFICKEVFDILIQKIEQNEMATVPMDSINAKLDNDFFAGRWTKITDRQREMLSVIARLENCQDEFTVQDVVAKSKELLPNPFAGGGSHVNQMLSTLAEIGIVYKNRHGKYSLAVPLLDKFILRQRLLEK